MRRGAGLLPACCALTVQLACGVESVELRPGGASSEAALPGESPESDAPSVPTEDTSSADGEAPQVGTGAGFTGAEVGAPGEPGCQKVDFLFVIDNSVSMFVAQNNLRNSFPGFMRVIRENVEADDFHIMVVDTDAWENDDDREDDGDACRSVLGAGRRTNGSTGADCGLPGSDRFITLDQPNLVETFSCMATVGTFGDNDEQPIDAMLAANSRVASAPDGCNAGFARQDAVLVVTLITNADDEARLDEPPDWIEALLAQKGSADSPENAQNATVVLALISDGTFRPPSGSLFDFSTIACQFLNSPRLQDFVEGLDHGQLASVCSPDYAPFFAQAVQSIDTACTEFTPPVIQ